MPIPGRPAKRARSLTSSESIEEENARRRALTTASSTARIRYVRSPKSIRGPPPLKGPPTTTAYLPHPPTPFHAVPKPKRMFNPADRIPPRAQPDDLHPLYAEKPRTRAEQGKNEANYFAMTMAAAYASGELSPPPQMPPQNMRDHSPFPIESDYLSPAPAIPSVPQANFAFTVPLPSGPQTTGPPAHARKAVVRDTPPDSLAALEAWRSGVASASANAIQAEQAHVGQDGRRASRQVMDGSNAAGAAGVMGGTALTSETAAVNETDTVSATDAKGTTSATDAMNAVDETDVASAARATEAAAGTTHTTGTTDPMEVSDLMDVAGTADVGDTEDAEIPMDTTDEAPAPADPQEEELIPRQPPPPRASALSSELFLNASLGAVLLPWEDEQVDLVPTKKPRIALTPTPPGGWPVTYVGDPAAGILGSDPGRAPVWWKYPANTCLFVDVFGEMLPRRSEIWRRMLQILALLRDIAGDDSIDPVIVAPELADDQGNDDRRRPANGKNPSTGGENARRIFPYSWFVHGLLPAHRQAALDQGVFSSEDVTIIVRPRTMHFPRLLMSVGGFTRGSDQEIAKIIQDTLGRAEVRNLIARFILDNPRRNQVPLADAVNTILASVQIKVYKLAEGNLVANVFADSPARDEVQYRLWRDALTPLKFRSAESSMGFVRPPRPCRGCHAVCHPSHLCPYPAILGWQGEDVRQERPVRQNDQNGPRKGRQNRSAADEGDWALSPRKPKNADRRRDSPYTGSSSNWSQNLRL